MRPSRKSLLLLPITSTLGILTLVSTFFISSDSASNSYALDGTNLQSEVTAEIDGTHYVTLSASDVTFSITPTNGTASDKKQVNVELSTNVSGGASLYLSTSSDKNALYLNGDTNSTSKNIASASSTTTYDNMANNTWAYSANDIDYQGVPTIDSPTLLTDIDGVNVGTNTNGVVSATIPIYYAAKVDTSIPSGSYANSVTYSAVVDGGIITSATLTKIEIDGAEVKNMQPEVENTLEITTNLMTNTYGTPRVYYETTSPAGYKECGDVVVSRNESGYMTITCKVTPTQAATGVTLHVVPKGNSDDRFCTDNTYQPDTSDCEAGDWKWGSFVIGVGDIVAPRILFNGITTMQEMTPQICADALENDTVRLQDTRDGKYYWVAKLADGNCWMTQNLDFDLGGHTLTPDDSDVDSDWNYESEGGDWYTSVLAGSNSNDAIQGWDLGDYVWRTPTSTKYCQTDTNLSESSCSSYWQSTAGMTAMTEPRTDGVTVDGSTYDAHYLVGNYYSYQAATADTAPPGSGDASSSICPAGWQLPTSGDDRNNTPGSFYYLLNQYSLTSTPTSGNNNIATSPLYFVRSGYVAPRENLYTAGGWGSYRSVRSTTIRIANGLYFDSSSVSPSGSNSRNQGISVRCVAPSA